MVWFLVDDKAHANTKIRKVLADDPAALALWTVAGSWCGDNLNDGFIPDGQLPWLIPVGGEELARKLVTHGLWRRVRGGFQFHEWAADGDGTRRNRTREEVIAERQKKAEAGRKGGLVSGQRRGKENNLRGGEGNLHGNEAPPSGQVDQRDELTSGARENGRREPKDTSGSGNTRSKPVARASADASARATPPASGLVEPLTIPIPIHKEPTSARADEPDGFAEFWAAYPPRKNSSKADAHKAYAAAIRKGAQPDEILAGAKLYAITRDGQDQQYTAHASTWIHGKRWEDLLNQPQPARQRAKFAWEN